MMQVDYLSRFPVCGCAAPYCKAGYRAPLSTVALLRIVEAGDLVRVDCLFAAARLRNVMQVVVLPCLRLRGSVMSKQVVLIS